MAPPLDDSQSESRDPPNGDDGLFNGLWKVESAERPPYAVGRMVARVVSIYLIVAALWIVVSDPLLAWLVRDPQLLVRLQIVKGWFFVLTTALLLFFLLRREAAHWTAERAARNEAEAASNLKSERQRLMLAASQLAWEAGEDESELSTALMRLVGPHVGAEVCLHYRRDEGNSDLNLIVGIGVHAAVFPAIRRLKEGSPFVELTSASGKPVVMTADEMASHPAGEQARLLEVQTFAAFPLLARDGRVLGTLLFASKTRREYAAEEVAFLQIVCRFVAVATERLRMMAALRESEVRVRQLFDLAPIPIFFASRDGRQVIFNRRFGEILGYTAEDVPSLDAWWPLAFREEGRRRAIMSSWERSVARAERDGTGLGPEEFDITCKNGEVRAFIISGVLLNNGVMMAFADITERRKADAALRESESRFRQVVENMGEVFWMNEPPLSRILYVSPAYKRIWGRECEELYAQPDNWLQTIHEDDRQRVTEAARTRQAFGRYDETYRILRPDGEVRWIHDRAFAVHDEVGRVCRIVGVAEDITERRTLEDQIRQSQKMEAIGTLAGGIAHDFNNILGAVVGQAELARMDSREPSTQSSLDEILRACKRASNLVSQILAFSRQQENKLVPLQLWRVVDEATRLLRATLPASIIFDISLDKGVPTVLADSTRIHQVVVNLCTNAAHAIGDRPGRLGVRLGGFEADAAFARVHPGMGAGSYVRLTVSDTGHGMERAVQERIFEPFFTTKAPGRGTGLGLAVVHGIVQDHNGVITVESEPGKGTVFDVYFPAHGEPEPVELPEEERMPRGAGERVLVVDDEPALAQMVGKLLVRIGYVGDVHTSPVEALEAFKSSPSSYKAVLMDLSMPVLTGVDLAAEMLQAQPTLPVILMSGFIPKEVQERIDSIAIREILIKPVTMQGISQALHRALHP